MSWLKNRFVVLAAVLVVINVAGLALIHYDLSRSRERNVHVSAAAVDLDPASADRLTLVFDRDVVPDDAVGSTEAARIVKIEPAVPGQWVWSARDRFEYRLEKPLPPGRIFHAVWTPEFRGRTGMTLARGSEVVFRTGALALERCEVKASDAESVTVELQFSQPVDPGDLLRHVRLFDDRSSASLGAAQCLTPRADKTLVIRSPLPPSGQLRLRLDEGLAGSGAEIPLGEAVNRTFEVTKEFALLAAYAERPRLEDMITVRLTFSQPLGGDQKLPMPEVTPAAAKLEVHRSNQDLVVTGEFKSGTTYRFKVPATLLAQSGKTLGKEASASVEIPDRAPDIEIRQGTGVLAPHGNLQLDARAVNVTALRLVAYRVHENNLVAHMRGTGSDETSRMLGEKTVKLDFPPNVPQKLTIDLKDLVQARRGIYSVTVTDTHSRWTSDRAVVSVTDLAITAKHSRDGLVVWVTGLQSGKPIAGAEVKALSLNNQTLATAATDERGLASLPLPANHPDGAPWAVIAGKDGDLSCLQLGDHQWEIDEVDQSGRPYAETYEVLLYSERGVFRPGDPIHMTGVVRDRLGHVPPPFPLAVKVTRPDGREVADLPVRLEPDRQGMFHVDYATRDDAQTGPYKFQATLPGDKKELGATQVLVEAFVPVRMEVKATPSAARFRMDEAPKLAVSARYLWDQPVAKVPVSLEGTLRATPFKSERYRAFRFGVPDDETINLPKVTATLDDQGKADLKIELPKPLRAGLYKMSLSATVTEPGGRSVSAGAATILDKLDRHVGLRLPGGQVVPVGSPISVDWVRVTGEDAPADPGEMEMELARVEYDTVLRREGHGHAWQSVERPEKVESRDIPAGDATGAFQFTCREPGLYRLTVTDRRTTSATRLDFYASEYGAGPQSLEMTRPELLQVVVDKEKYVPGDTAKVLVRSPLSGTMLLTLETDHVVASYVAEVANNTAEVQVPLPADTRGGAFLLATVIRPVDPDRKSWLPHRAMGMARVVMDHAAQHVPLSITAPPKARPGQAVPITVETGTPSDPAHPTMVHLWAVDEGILLAAAYHAPAIEKFFLGPRAPGVETADLFLSLLPDYKRPVGMTRIGAGGGDRSVDNLRRNPVATRRREPAVVWRAAAPVDASGRLTVEMKMPDLVGQMRLMAVAVDQDRYASAERPVTLTQPLIVEATWPRFVAPGDTFEVPMKLFNSTDRALTVRVAAKITGPVEVVPDPALERLTIKPGEPITHFLKAHATGLGPVEVTLEAGPAEADADLAAHTSATFPVRPATALHAEVKLASLKAGEKLQVPLPTTMVKGTIRATVDVSPRPTVQLGPALEQLIHYPYGCVEQTSSQLFALLYAGEVLGPDRADAIKGMVQSGIARLWSMQTRSGGLSYWPGGSEACLWGTAYASSCLLEAKAAGHEIDPRFTRELTKYLAAELQATGDGAPDANTRALICRVLAVFGDPPNGWMARLAEQQDKLDVAGRAHLAAAFSAAGRKDRAATLLPTSIMVKDVAITSDERLISPVRQDGVLLGALLEIDPKHGLMPPLAARLEKARHNGYWGSTLDNAAAISALSRYQAQAGAEKQDFTGTIRCGAAEPVPFDHTKAVSHKFADPAAPIEIASTGTGTIYVSVAAEGLAEKGVLQPYSRDLAVERHWVGGDGKPVDPQKLRVGDLVRVIVTIRSPRDVKNVAVVDALPGGMEVENPRLATSATQIPPALFGRPQGDDPDTDEDEDASSDSDAAPAPTADAPRRAFDRPDHVEFLDDRVVLFCEAGSTPRVFSYAVRVTAAGDFDLPPIQASCMYDPAAACLGKAGRIKATK